MVHEHFSATPFYLKLFAERRSEELYQLHCEKVASFQLPKDGLAWYATTISQYMSCA